MRSVDIGSLRLTAAMLPSDPPTPAEIERARAIVRSGFAELDPPRPELALATGGSARAVARIVGHEYGADDLERVIELLAARPAAASAKALGLRPDRARTLLAGAIDPRRGLAAAGRTVHALARRDPGRRRAAARRPARRGRRSGLTR